MECYIVDDHPAVVKTISDYILDTPALKLVYSTSTAQEIIPYLSEIETLSVLFLDIDMPKISGLKIAEMANDKTAVVFITGHTEYAIEAFHKGAYDYLLKPFSYERFLEAINKINRRKSHTLLPQKKEHTFVFNKYGDLIRINFCEIYFIKAEANYVAIHKYDGVISSRIRLKDVLAEFPADTFIQIHKSYIISIDKVHKLSSDDTIVMANEQKTHITVGRPYMHHFLSLISGSVTKHEKKAFFRFGR